MDGQTDGRTDGRTDRSTDRQRADEWMDEWTDRWTDGHKDMQIRGLFAPFPQKKAKKAFEKYICIGFHMDNGQREGQTDGQIDGQSERWTNRNTDIGTSGRRDFPPLSPQSGIESLKSTSIGFYLEQWTN